MADTPPNTPPNTGRTADGRFAKGNPGNPRRRKRELRTDGLVNAFTGHGTSRDRRTWTRHRTRPLRDVDALDLARGNWLAKRIVWWLPKDCFRKGYTIYIPGQPELVKKLTTAIGNAGGLELNKRIKRAGALARAAGGAALFPVLEGALPSLEKEFHLDEDGKRIVKVKAIHVLEPRELLPVEWYEDIEHPKFRRPAMYEVQPLSGGMKSTKRVLIHESRLVVFGGERLTAEALPGQRWGWDDNVLTPVHEVLFDYGISWGSAATLLQNFSQRVIKFAQLAEMLKEGDEGERLVKRRVELMDMVSSTLRALPLDKEDDLVNVTTTVGGLADLLVELAQVVCAAADMTMTRLFGRAPAGLNATGEYDQQADHERIETEQEDVYTQPLESLLRMVLLSQDGPTRGQEPPDWSIGWNPLKQQDPKQIAETRKVIAETDAINIDAGLYTARIAAESHWKGDKFNPEITIDWKEWEKQMKIEEEAAEAIARDPAAVAALGRAGEQQQQRQRGTQDPDGDEDEDQL